MEQFVNIVLVSASSWPIYTTTSEGPMRKMDLTEDQTKILKALNTLTEPAGCKLIGEAADMPWRSVMAKLRGLKKEELVESPDKGVYIISDKGKAAIS